MQRHSYPLKFLLFSLFLMLMSGCQSNALKKPETPKFSVAAIKPANLSFNSQTFIFTLKAQNPNNFPIDIAGVKFNTIFSNQDIAQGKSQQAFTLKANNDTLFDIEVTTQLIKSIGDFTGLLKNRGINLNYTLDGELDVAQSPIDIPFSVDGNLIDFIRK